MFRAFRRVTTRDMPVASLLGDLRYLPRRLRGTAASRPVPRAPPPFLEELVRNRTGVPAETPGVEIVLGTIGKFHQIADQEFVAFAFADG